MASLQSSLAMQLDLPAFAGRASLRIFALDRMLAELKAAKKGTRGKSIVVHRKIAHSRQWFACLLCDAQSRPWSSATNPPSKWALSWRDGHRAKHADAWLVERGYVVPGADRDIDLVLGDVIVRAFGALQVVS